MQNNHLNMMLNKALEAKKFSHSPYSNFAVGACIYTNNGNYYVGANVENASYPLGLCAEGAAIAAMVMGGEKNIKEILVVGSKKEICSPCGGCRQKIREFSSSSTLIHLSDGEKIVQTIGLNDLLPLSFGPDNL